MQNRILLNDGTASFSDSGQRLAVERAWGRGCGDLDGDGDIDLVVTDILGNTKVFLNDGTGVFVDSGQLLDRAAGAALADIDLDGDLDLGLTTKSGVRFYYNVGEGILEARQSWTGRNEGASQSSFGDLNGDGYPDFAMASGAAGARILINELNSQPPMADAGGTYLVDEGATVELDASASSDPDGEIVLYEWDLDNDGEYDDATGVTAEQTYDDNGTFQVGLRVTDDLGEVDTDSAEVVVKNVAPTILSIDAPQEPVATANQPVSAQVTFSDPGLSVMSRTTPRAQPRRTTPMPRRASTPSR